jgi:hypothetical protein
MRLPVALLVVALAPAFGQTDTTARLARAFEAIDRAAAASTVPGMVIESRTGIARSTSARMDMPI